MEYIKSKDIFILIRDTLKLIHPRLIEHGSKVAYMVYKMLCEKGVYEEFERADIVMLTTLHDIGAYKTEEGSISDMLRYESRDSRAHTIYGYLFLKYLSPMEDMAKVIMYHHTDYEQLKDTDYEYKDLAAYINIAEKMDLYSSALGSQFNMQMFHKQAGTKLSSDGLNLFYHTAKKHDMFEKLKSGDYKKDLDYIVDFMIFSNEDKKRLLEMLMYCIGFRSESSVVDSITTVSICEALADKLRMSDEEKERLYYGALLHDLGMLAVPREILDANRKLNSDEIKQVRTHVNVIEKLFGSLLREDIINIAAAHHERGDGSGYPKKLRSMAMNREQKVLQVADAVTGMTSKRSYREPLDKIQVINILNEEVSKNRFDKTIVLTLINHYDSIMKKVQEGSAEIMKMYQTIHSQYDTVSKRYHI